LSFLHVLIDDKEKDEGDIEMGDIKQRLVALALECENVEQFAEALDQIAGFEFVSDEVIAQLWQVRCAINEMVEEVDVE
jgi:hypothetical protein